MINERFSIIKTPGRFRHTTCQKTTTKKNAVDKRTGVSLSFFFVLLLRQKSKKKIKSTFIVGRASTTCRLLGYIYWTMDPISHRSIDKGMKEDVNFPWHFGTEWIYVDIVPMYIRGCKGDWMDVRSVRVTDSINRSVMPPEGGSATPTE